MREEILINDAFDLAINAHRGGCRKGSAIPYLVHPMDVASILLKNGADYEIVTAGLLHDVLEDTDTDVSLIESRFGPRVASLVRGASEPNELKELPDKAASWRPRKQHTIEFITGADRHMKMLSCADKLANIRDMLNDRLKSGEAFWDKFNAPKEDQEWYYSGMLEAFGTGEDIMDLPMYLQFEDCVKRLFG